MGTGGLFLRKLRAKVAAEPTGFVWVQQGKLAGSGYPASRSQVEWLVKEGIDSVLTLTIDPLPADFTRGLDVVTGHVPMQDHQPPSVGAMDRAVDFIEEQLAGRKAVLVHCLAGEGRTGCVLAAYLIKTKGLDADSAMTEIRKAKPEFIERRQESAVREFSAQMPGSEERQ
ncbi:MAG TPA: dual specificity protein phosphatase family protein [Nitrososphaerales archaeon]|nr:dual specificity protein phosphatase family protein [Nitrososphaerales archaeon]